MDINDFKTVIIHGKDDEVHNIKDGQIEYIGSDADDIHSNCLLEYASINYSDIEIFKRLNTRHRPEVIGFMFLHFLNDVIFFNTTKDLKKYGRTGIFLLPNTLSPKQKEVLCEFANSIENYGVGITYSLRLEDGRVMGDEIYGFDKETPRELINQYLNAIEKNKQM